MPDHADGRRWATSQGPVSYDCPRNPADLRSHCFSESTPKGLSHNQRGLWDYRDGGFPDYSTAMFDFSGGYYSGFSPYQPSESLGLRYGSDPFSSRGPLMRGPSFGESIFDRRRRSSLFCEGSIHATDPFSPYESSGLPQPPHDYGGYFRFEDPAYEGYWRPY